MKKSSLATKRPAEAEIRPKRKSASSIRKDSQVHANFLTPTEVADRLLVAPVTVRLWASKGLLPSVTTLGGHRRFREEDVENFVLQHQHTSSKAAVPQPRSIASILIIDDDPQFARYLSVLIANHAPGVILEIAHDGFSAGMKCQMMRPDIVTLDLQMPDMNGFDVCMLIRSMFGRTRPRIVALTGFASKRNIERVIATGADACVAKTAPVEVLLRELAIPLFGSGKNPS